MKEILTGIQRVISPEQNAGINWKNKLSQAYLYFDLKTNACAIKNK